MPFRTLAAPPSYNAVAMERLILSSVLQGGDLRSLGEANRVAALILNQPERFAELLECLWHDDPVVRMRAADAAEKITARKPELLRPFKLELLGLARETGQQEVRWHLALILPRLPLAGREFAGAVALLTEFLNDRSAIVKTCALQGLAEMAKIKPEFREGVIAQMETAARTGSPAMKARARKLLPPLRRLAGGSAL